MKQWWQNVSKTDIRNVISIIAVMGVFALVFVLVFHEVPTNNKELVNMVAVQIVSTLLGGLVGYLFGTSKKENDRGSN
jgi:hypothetical protein